MSKRSALANMAVLGVSLVAAIAVIEVGLRVAGISFPSLNVIDPHRGYALAPGAESWQKSEGSVYIRINRQGLRDREHSIEKPANTVRIAVLGDSQAAAMQVPMEKTFWAVLERELAGCAATNGKTVEVINFGVNGYGTAQELLTLRHHVWKYDPDIVLLAFMTGNDIRDNTRALKGNPTIPYFVIDGDRLVLDDRFRQGLWFRVKLAVGAKALSTLRNRSRTFQLLMKARGVAPGMLRKWIAADRRSRPATRAAPPGVEDGLDHEIYLPSPGPIWEGAWRVTERLILEIDDEVNARGAALWVVTLTNGIQVHPDPAVRKKFIEWRGVDDLLYPERRIRALGEREGIPVINLAPSLADYAERTGTFLHGFNRTLGGGHWNVDGHRLAGQVIASRLCDAGAATFGASR